MNKTWEPWLELAKEISYKEIDLSSLSPLQFLALLIAGEKTDSVIVCDKKICSHSCPHLSYCGEYNIDELKKIYFESFYKVTRR